MTIWCHVDGAAMMMMMIIELSTHVAEVFNDVVHFVLSGAMVSD